jgi:hypothetical protein
MIKYLKIDVFSKFMKKLDERLTPSDVAKGFQSNDEVMDSYQVAYSFDNNIIKTVKIDKMLPLGFGFRYSGVLHIQKIGLDPSMETLKFSLGKPDGYANLSIENDGAIFPLRSHYTHFSDVSQDFINKILKNFGKEFKPIFDENKKLKEDLPTYFKALIPYLK